MSGEKTNVKFKRAVPIKRNGDGYYFHSVNGPIMAALHLKKTGIVSNGQKVTLKPKAEIKKKISVTTDSTINSVLYDGLLRLCIVHYNTPILTTALVKSINKTTPNTHIYIFDNSDKAPFRNTFENVTVFDNTKGQIIDFDEWLKGYPKRNLSAGKANGWGSAKHCYTVEKCMDLIGENFILLDSDVLIKKNLRTLWDESYAYVGQSVIQPKSNILRVLPFVMFLNVKMCQSKGIHYFDKQYMHGLMYTTIADRYDTGAGFYINAKKAPHKEVDISGYIEHFKGGSWDEVHKKKVTAYITPGEWLHKNRRLWKEPLDLSLYKKVVYTCITGGYDKLNDNIRIAEGWNYVCFTDNPNLQSKVWEIRPLPKETEGLSNVKKQRYIKICPHMFLPEYDLSIWIDGVVDIKGDIGNFIKDKCDNGCVFIPAHPDRKCIYAESEACIRLKKDTRENIAPQMNLYKKEGFPKDYGLVQTNIMVRFHNDIECIKLMDKWWEVLRKYSHRDQLSFNYALWKTKIKGFVAIDKKTCRSDIFWWNATKHLRKK